MPHTHTRHTHQVVILHTLLYTIHSYHTQCTHTHTNDTLIHRLTIHSYTH
jgi:hypothetical protein